MSLPMLNAIKAIRGSITPTQRFVAWVLADCHNEQTGRCDPSIAFLMESTGYSNRTICTALDELEKAGHLTSNGSNGQRKSYKLHPKTSELNDKNQCSSFTGEALSPVNLTTKTSEPVAQTSEPVAKSSEGGSHETEGNGNRTRKNQNSGSRQKEDDTDFRSACAFDLDLMASQQLRDAWGEWQAYRQQRHWNKGSKHLNWTLQAARLSVSSINRAVEQYGEQAVVAQIYRAIEGSWQGMNLDKMTASPMLKSGSSDREKTEEQSQLERLFNRDPDAPWSLEEQRLYDAYDLIIQPDDMRRLKILYSSRDNNLNDWTRPASLLGLLRRIGEVLDTARTYRPPSAL